MGETLGPKLRMFGLKPSTQNFAHFQKNQIIGPQMLYTLHRPFIINWPHITNFSYFNSENLIGLKMKSNELSFILFKKFPTKIEFNFS